MQFDQFTYIGIILCIIGAILLAVSKKERKANGEWGQGLQWGYLLVTFGVFGILSSAMSLTAVLLVCTLLTGAIWLWKKFSVAKTVVDSNHFRDYMAEFFPLVLGIFILRTFIAEPFQIPSSSMRPGLVTGDFVLVNKFSYGIRMPIINSVMIDTGKIEHGDVVVFNYPEQPRLNYIKRAIGLPGDLVEYKDKVLTVNGQVFADRPDGTYSYTEMLPGGAIEFDTDQYRETAINREYAVLKEADKPAVVQAAIRKGFPFSENCQYAADGSGFSCKVPEGHYFMMGDNRDGSGDSRYWGFVDDKLIVGKAFFIWMNLGDFSRIGTRIQ